MDSGAQENSWREKVVRLKKLVAASQALATVESVEELLPILLLMAQDVTEAEASSILLYDPDREVLKFALAMNETKDGVQETLRKNIELKVGEGVAGWVALEKKCLRVDDASKDDRIYKAADKATGFVTRNLLCVPILHDSNLLGVAQVVNAKDRDHFDDDDLELLESFAHLASVAIVRRNLMESRLREQRMKSQLEAAARIQEHFWPNPPEGLGCGRIQGSTRPATSVGGDLYDYIQLKDGRWLVCLGDVAGKGLPAAMVMAAMWAKLRALALVAVDLGTLMAELNMELLDVMGGEVFVTMVSVLYDPHTGAAELALAGHIPPLMTSNGTTSEIAGVLGLPLGVEPDVGYDVVSFDLKEGSTLLLVSDGVTEARAPSGDFFGFERLTELCRQHNSQGIEAAVQQAVEQWRNGREANDDTTVVSIER